MHLFIDTNVLLSFYHFTADDLEELKKLVVLLKRKELLLCLPSQVLSEFQRNREAKIADALKRLREQRLNFQFPQICKDYVEYRDLRKLQAAYEKQHAALLNKLTDDIRNRSLKADAIIAELFSLAENVRCDDPVIRRARDRVDLGNPPGKGGSLGDAVNWEALLDAVPREADLHFVTDDKDYCSALDEEAFCSFLSAEWQEKKKSNIVFYKRMSAFFKERFPDITLATELEKDLLIQDLANSSTFARTHTVIAKLLRYVEFTPMQLNAIVTATLLNSQVRSIIGDSDVRQFLSTAVGGNEGVIEKDTLEALRSLMAPPKEEHARNDDFPF
jgi:hypothetical protein